MFDDGRFKLIVDGKVLFDMERTGKFPNYEDDVRRELASLVHD
jgi:hypothetical protein